MVGFDRLLEPTLLAQDLAEGVGGKGEVGIEADRFAVLADHLIVLPLARLTQRLS